MDFSITQILRETNFGDFRSAKLAISTHLEALNFDFQEFLHFLKAVIYQIDKSLLIAHFFSQFAFSWGCL